MMNRRRVVITGYGAVSCVGNDVNTMWDSVINGRCGIGRVTLFDPTDFKTQVGGEVKNLNWSGIVSEKDYRSLTRGSSQPRDHTQVSHIAGGFFTN